MVTLMMFSVHFIDNDGRFHRLSGILVDCNSHPRPLGDRQVKLGIGSVSAKCQDGKLFCEKDSTGIATVSENE